MKHGRAISLSMALIVAAGVYAYLELPRGLYPELSFPRIAVVATLPDATSEIVLRNVTRPLEEALMPVLGVRRVRSKTIRGACEIDVLFDPSSEMVMSLQLVQARLADIRGELPAETQVVAERITPTSFPVYTLNVEGSVPPTQLRDVALYQVRTALSRVPGVGPITVTAGFEREIEVEVDAARAEAAGLTLDEIARRLSEANRFGTVGRLDRAYRRYAIVVRGGALDLVQMKEFVVGGSDRAPVKLGDLAKIREGWADPRMVVRSPSGPSAVVNVARRIGGDVTSLDDGLEKAVARLQKEMPPGIRLVPVYQQAPLIEAATGAVRDAILIGALLSALVIFAFLRSLRATLIAAVTIPSSLLAACAVLLWFRGSLNLMSLGGMAIAVGLVIDDAVVVIEAIHRELALGKTPLEAAQLGVSRLAGPVLSSTVTTVVVFAPLAFLSGVVGTFFAALSLALAAAVIASLILALTVVPLMASRLGPAPPDDGGGEERLAPRYAGLLARTLGRPGRIVAVALAVTALGIFSSRFVESGFLPEIDEGAYVIDYFTPIGTSLEEADHLGQSIDQILRDDEDVQTFTRRLGAELGPPRATETSRGDVMVRLKTNHRSIDDVMEEQRKKIAARLPGVRVELIQLLGDMLGDLEGNPEPIELKIFGPDEAELRRQAARVAAAIKPIDGIVDLFNGQIACSPERVVRLDAVKLGRLGMSTAQVMAQISAAQLGAESTPLPEQDRLIPVRVRWPDVTRFDEHVLERIRLRTPAGGWVPLAEVGRVEDSCAPSEITRENLRLMVTVTARLENRDLGSAVREVQEKIAAIALPSGYAIEIGGQHLSQHDSFRSLGLAIGCALLLVLLVLVFQFGSFRASFSILAALPLALAGGLLALVIARVPLNVSSLLGGILLVGLVVKNGILLIHRAREREAKGAGTREALVDAARLRMRPILMTTLCTLFGLIPLALGFGEGAEMHRPLAIAVLGGLALSTLGTLFVVPALYALWAKKR
jgi:CzcA family heavy metal efflux pump